MTSLVFKGIAARKLRTTLTAVAIVLGAAMVTGTLIVGHTVKGRLPRVVHPGQRRVRGRDHADISPSATPTPTSAPDTPARRLARRAGRGTSPAWRSCRGPRAGQLDRDRSRRQRDRRAPVRPHWSPRPSPTRSSPRSTWSTAACRRRGTRSRSTLVGRAGEDAGRRDDQARHRRPDPHYRVVGLIKFSGIGTATARRSRSSRRRPRGRSSTARTRSTASRSRPQPGVSPAGLVENLKAAHLASPVALDILTAKADGLATEKRDGAFVDILQTILLAFGGVALLVGAFVIFNTFSITVAQRTRELALLRTLGAARRQVLGASSSRPRSSRSSPRRSARASASRSPPGCSALFTALGLDAAGRRARADARDARSRLRARRHRDADREHRAGRARDAHQPDDGAARGAAAERSPARCRWSPRSCCSRSAAASLGYGVLGNPSSTNTRLLLIAVGSLTLILGTAASASRLVGPIVRVTGSPMRRFGGLPGTLASENARRNPGRTATTSAALMIGIAVVAFFAIFAYAITGNNNHELQKHVRSTYVVAPTADGAKIDGAPPVRSPACPASRPSRRSPARSRRSTAAGPRDLRRRSRRRSSRATVLWKHGSDGLVPALGAHDALMPDSIATERARCASARPSRSDARRGEGRVPARGHVRRPALPRRLRDPAGTWHSLFKSVTRR